LNQNEYVVDFTQGLPSDWTVSGNYSIDPDMGIVLPLWLDWTGPVLVSNWNIFFGEVTCNIQHAPGSGVDSAFIMISDTLDELDWEIMGYQLDMAQMNMWGREKAADTILNLVNTPVNNPQGEYP
jgi:hypothetical protein